MLRPLVRINRCPPLRCRCTPYARHIHTTPARAVDESDDPSRPQQQQQQQHQEPSAESPEDGRPRGETAAPATSLHLTAEGNGDSNSAFAEDGRPRDQWPDLSEDTYDQVADEMFSSRLPSKYNPEQFEGEFQERRRKHVGRVVEMRKKFNIGRSALIEKTRQHIQTAYQARKDSKDAANQRGLDVFEMVNKARIERGEKPLLWSSEREPPEKGQRDAGSWSENQPEGEDRSMRSSRDRREREDGDKRKARFDSRRQLDKEQGGIPLWHNYAEAKLEEIEALRTTEVPEGNLDDWAEPYPPLIRATKFIRPFDEVDYELGYDLPDAEIGHSKFKLLSRDGVIQEHRRTTRDHDQLPVEDDVATHFDVSILGQIGESYYYPKPYDMPDVSDIYDVIAKRIEGTEFPEDNEQDPAELYQIEKEIKEGMSRRDRAIARKDREIHKIMKKYYDKYTENMDIGSWAKQVPLPVPHDPSTADLDEYVPPKFTHNAFRFGTPAIPYGVQGRQRSMYAAAADPTVSAQPYRLYQFDAEDLLSDTPTEDEQKAWEATKDDLIKAIEGYEPPESWIDWKYRDKEKPVVLPIRKAGPTKKRHGKGSTPIKKIEDIYDPRSLAVWREMHKDWVAPKDAKFPEYESEDEIITPWQEREEAAGQVKAWEAMDNLDNALLKTFRRRDKYEIKDIRRRLGLSFEDGMDTGNQPVKIINLTDTSQSLLSLGKEEKEGQVLKGEIVNEKEEKEVAKPKDLHPTEDPEFVAKLGFWREAKQYITVLSARIEHLRSITRDTLEQLHRHGYAVALQHLATPDTAPTSCRPQITEDADPSSIVAKLYEQFQSINTKFKQLEMLATATIQGPAGPQDPEYSEEWIEWHVHQDEKKEFAEVAARMGYKNLEMEPQATPEQRQELENLEKMWFDSYSRIGVGGEYENSGITPETQEGGAYGVLANYVAQSGMSDVNKAIKLAGFSKTFEQRGWKWVSTAFDDEDEEEENDESQGANEGEERKESNDGAEDDASTAEELGDSKWQQDAERPANEDTDKSDLFLRDRTLPDGQTVTLDSADINPEDIQGLQYGYGGIDIEPPIDITPPPRVPLEEQWTISRLREALRKTFKDLDEDIKSLENDYDAFIARNPSHDIPETLQSMGSQRKASKSQAPPGGSAGPPTPPPPTQETSP